MASLRVWMGVSAIAAAIGIGACSQAADNKAPPIDSVACEDAGPKCGTGANSSTNPPKADAAADAAAEADAAPLETTAVSLTVGVLDTLFSDQTAIGFKNTGFLSVPTLTGQKDYPIDADAGAGMVIDGVVVGDGWFQVRPTTNADLFTTHSLLTVSKSDPILLVPVIDRVQLGIIYTSTPLAAPLQQTAGQIIVMFSDQLGARVSGIRVTDSPFEYDGLLYDNGAGSFQSDSGSLQTGTAGIAIFANVSSGIGSFAYDFQGTVHASPAISWVIGQATVVHIRVTRP